MIIDLISKKEINSYGGRKDCYIINATYKPTPPEEPSYISLVRNKSYFVDYKIFSGLEGYLKIYPYQSLLPLSYPTNDLFVIDKLGNYPVVSVVKDGIPTISYLFERDITKEELSRLAVAHDFI